MFCRWWSLFTNFWGFPLGLMCCLQHIIHRRFTSRTGAVNSFIRRVLISSSADAAEHQIQSGLLWGTLNRWAAETGTTANFTFLVCRERPCSRRYLVLCQGIGVKGKQSAALLCTSSVFTCLHRCMSSASGLTCAFLMHLFTIRVLGRLLKWAWVGFCRVQNGFYIIFRFFWPWYLFTLMLKCN